MTGARQPARNRRPEYPLSFPTDPAGVVEWIRHDERDLFELALDGAGITSIDGFYIEPSTERGSIVYIACPIGFAICWVDRRTNDGMPGRVVIDITPWADVKDPEMRVVQFPSEFHVHLTIQVPRLDLSDMGGSGGHDFVGTLGRAILRHKSR